MKADTLRNRAGKVKVGVRYTQDRRLQLIFVCRCPMSFGNLFLSRLKWRKALIHRIIVARVDHLIAPLSVGKEQMAAKLLKKIGANQAVVGVIGLGYVGLPLAREFASAGLKVIGFDIDEKKVKVLNSGRSIIKHIPHSQVRQIVKAKLFAATTNMARLKTVDAILVCVPTPLTESREPDMRFVERRMILSIKASGC